MVQAYPLPSTQIRFFIFFTQDNVHHAALTVRQTLDFAAKLRMAKTASARQREDRVRYMVSMLRLQGEVFCYSLVEALFQSPHGYYTVDSI